jgi:hypothetical protein
MEEKDVFEKTPKKEFVSSPEVVLRAIWLRLRALVFFLSLGPLLGRRGGGSVIETSPSIGLAFQFKSLNNSTTPWTKSWKR